MFLLFHKEIVMAREDLFSGDEHRLDAVAGSEDHTL